MSTFSAFPRDDEVCTVLEKTSTLNTIISIILLVGILLSYLVQHIRIITLRSSRGISPFWILLGETSATCAFGNILLAPTTQMTFGCCTRLGPWRCVENLLGVMQIGVQWGSFTVILALFLIYYPRATSALEPASPTHPPYRTAVLITIISILHIAFVLIMTVLLFTLSSPSLFPSRSKTWGDILGVSAAILASIQYIPQIWTTWRLKAVGSLSIPMMCLQTPGGFIWAGSLAARLGWKGWSTWSIFLVSGTLQGVLLGMAVVFELRIKKRGLQGVDERVARGESVDETTALLANDGVQE